MLPNLGQQQHSQQPPTHGGFPRTHTTSSVASRVQSAPRQRSAGGVPNPPMSKAPTSARARRGVWSAAAAGNSSGSGVFTSSSTFSGPSPRSTVINGFVNPTHTSGVHYLRAHFRDFLHRFGEDQKLYASSSLHVEVALKQLLQETQELPRPNAYRAAGVCTLLVRLCRAFECQQATMHQLLDEVMACVYDGYQDGDFERPEMLTTHQLFSDQHTNALADRSKTEIKLLQFKHAQEKHVGTTERIISTWQLMHQERVFIGWRNYMRQQNRLHEAVVAQYSGSRVRETKRSVLGAWRLLTVESRYASSQQYNLKELRQLTESNRHLSKELTYARQDMAEVQTRLDRATDMVHDLQDTVDLLRAEKKKLEELLDGETVLRRNWEALGNEVARNVTRVEARAPRAMLTGQESESAFSPLSRRAVIAHFKPRDVLDLATPPHDRVVHLWIRDVIETKNIPEKLPTNLNEDFRNGDIFLSLCRHLMHVDPAKVAVARKDMNPVTRCSFYLHSLERYVGHELPLQAVDLSEGHADTVIYSLAKLMEQYVLNEIGAWEHSNDPEETTAHVRECRGSAADWAVLCQHVVLSATKKLVDRSGARDAEERMQLDLQYYHNLERERLEDIFVSLDVDEEDDKRQLLRNIRDTAKQNAMELRRVFKFYCPAGCMNLHAYLTFLTECKILRKPKIFSKKQALKIFDLVNQTSDVIRENVERQRKEARGVTELEEVGLAEEDPANNNNHPNNSAAPTNDAQEEAAFTQRNMMLANPDDELTPIEFVDALVHIAVFFGDATEPLAQRLLRLIRVYILQNACTSSVDEFRHAVNSKAIQNILSQHNTGLLRVFRKYASGRSEGIPDMKEKDFIELLKDARQLDTTFGVESAKTMFRFMQSDEPLHVSVRGGAADGPALLEAQQSSAQQQQGATAEDNELLDYKEFLDAIVALAFIRVPHPWVPMSDRLHKYLRDTFLPMFKKKK
eukprot:PhM_4_TR2421/c0_g1_i1/m.38945